MGPSTKRYTGAERRTAGPPNDKVFIATSQRRLGVRAHRAAPLHLLILLACLEKRTPREDQLYSRQA